MHRPGMFLTCCLPISSKPKSTLCWTCSRTTRLTQTPPGSAKASRRGDIDTVTVGVTALDDDVAEIDADAQLYAPLLGDAIIAQC